MIVLYQANYKVAIDGANWQTSNCEAYWQKFALNGHKDTTFFKKNEIMTDLFSDLLGKNGDFGKKWRFLEVFNKIPWSKNAVSDTNSACFFGKIQQNWEENQTGHENVLSIYHDGGVSPRLTTYQ